MISIFQTTKMTDLSVVASRSLCISDLGTGLSGGFAERSGAGMSLAALPVRERNERNERPTQAPEAAVATAQVTTYAAAAAGAESRTKQHKHHTMWAFRGLEPWSDPA